MTIAVFAAQVGDGVTVSEYSPVDEAVKRPAVAGAMHIVAKGDCEGTMYDRIVPHVDDPSFAYFDMFGGAAGTGGGGSGEATSTAHVLDEERLMVFDRTRTIFQIVGRGEPITSSQFCRCVPGHRPAVCPASCHDMWPLAVSDTPRCFPLCRFIRKCGLMPPRSTIADLDLLFIKATKRRDSDLGRSPMGVTQVSVASVPSTLLSRCELTCSSVDPPAACARPPVCGRATCAGGNSVSGRSHC